ncbi:MAG: hypothetical protein CL790_04405 [Chloroflexi bacterium]|nr:hypothetical protein [Chloroflexota bacterium]|tara:strand:+ start:4063 stop:4611 length:549 start_codon:yes stop_codon:yes gene_type:complete
MLHHAGSAPVEIDFREGRAEQIPVRMAEVRLVFMSMMFHHIEDLDAAIAEFGRVLQGGGFVCVRNSTLDSLDSYPYLEHFPGARSACESINRSIEEINRRFVEQGFRTVTNEVITQPAANSPAAYSEKVGCRVYSDLNMISDEEFAAGLNSLRSAMAELDPDEPVNEEIDLLVYSKVDTPAT